MHKLIAAALLLAALQPLVTSAAAATVSVFVAGAARAALPAITESFGRETGHTEEASFDTVGALSDRVLKGERPDLVILSAPAISALPGVGGERSGLILARVRGAPRAR